jgi:hypothetical protein
MQMHSQQSTGYSRSSRCKLYYYCTTTLMKEKECVCVCVMYTCSYMRHESLCLKHLFLLGYEF